MRECPSSSLYLACLSPALKKRSSRKLKAIQAELDLLVGRRTATALIHREGSPDVPYAGDAFRDELVYPEVQILYFFSDSREGGKLFLSSKSSKRIEVNPEKFSFDPFPDLKLLILDGHYSLDLAEKFLFSGARSVLLLSPSLATGSFRQLFFSSLLRGASIENALQRLGESQGIRLPHYTIPSDPYEYWDWKEKRQEEASGLSCLLNLQGAGIMNWRWLASEEKEESVPKEIIEEEAGEEAEPLKWFEGEGRFATWRRLTELPGYRDAREREYIHIAARAGNENPHPVKSDSILDVLPMVSPEKSYSAALEPSAASDAIFEEVGEIRGERQEDTQAPAGSSASGSSWPLMSWLTLALALFTFVSLAYLLPGRQTPRLSDFQSLSDFSSTSDYNVLLLPFAEESVAADKDSWAERTVRDWVNTLKESEELGINLMYASGSNLPHTAEEAKRIGEIYDANLVIWGDYGAISSDTLSYHLRYVCPNGSYDKAGSEKSDPIAAAFNDVYDLQEGFLSGGIQDINHWILATAYLKKGDYRPAFSNLQLIQEQDERGMAVIHQMMAKCYLGLEYFDECIDAYSTAIRFDSTNANAYFQRANVYRLTQRNQHAIHDYRMALRVNPNHLGAKAKLTSLMAELEKVELAVPSLTSNDQGSFSLLPSR